MYTDPSAGSVYKQRSRRRIAASLGITQRPRFGQSGLGQSELGPRVEAEGLAAEQGGLIAQPQPVPPALSSLMPIARRSLSSALRTPRKIAAGRRFG
jgi:hypothetical protein